MNFVIKIIIILIEINASSVFNNSYSNYPQNYKTISESAVFSCNDLCSHSFYIYIYVLQFFH